MRQQSFHIYERVASVLLAGMIAAVISVFDTYWWEETFTIAYMTLLSAAIIQLIVPWRMYWLKILAQFGAAVAITIGYLPDQPQVSYANHEMDWLYRFYHEISVLHPFIWISFILLICYLLCLYWSLYSKLKIICIVTLCIFTIGMVDSFTPYMLWDDVVITVMLALGWFGALHMHNLRKLYPSSWTQIRKRPQQQLIPLVLVVALLAGLGIQAPAWSPVLKDPYTLWQEATGEEVGGTGKGGNSPGKQDGRGASGYSRDDRLLGGGFNFDHTPVMTVTSNRKSYWRGETKNFYTGKGWSDEIPNGQERLFDDYINIDRQGFVSDTAYHPKSKNNLLIQRINILENKNYPVLFGASSIIQIMSLDGAPSARMFVHWSPSRGELRWEENGNVDYPMNYTIASEELIIDEEVLRETSAIIRETQWSDFYLQLPDQLPDRVRSLAREITSDAASDYERAKALESYLKSNFKYTTTPDLSRLSGMTEDFTDQFLFELQEGYCDYYSTAMVVMARSLSMPARWVKGFAPGETSGGIPESVAHMGGEADAGSGTYTVRNSDAHSWPEIYFKDYGWVAFEPTAGFSLPSAPLADLTVEEEEEQKEEEKKEEIEETTKEDKEKEKEQEQEDAIPPLPIGGMGAGLSSKLIYTLVSTIIIAAAVIGWLIWRRRAKLTGSRRASGAGEPSNNDKIIAEAQKLFRSFERFGLLRKSHETLQETVNRWLEQPELAAVKEHLREQFVKIEQASYGNQQLTNEEVERIMQHSEKLAQSVKDIYEAKSRSKNKGNS